MTDPLHVLVTNADQGPNWWDGGIALASAVLGALVGAIPAFLLAKRSSNEVLARDREARREQQKAAGLRAHVKLGRILNSMLVVQAHLRKNLEDPPAIGAEYWQSVQPLIGSETDAGIEFDADEAALFLAAGRGDYAETLLLLARRHAVQVVVLRVYAERKAQLRRDMPPPESVGTDYRGSTHMDRATSLKLRPQMVELNSMIADLIAHLQSDIATAMRAAKEFGPLLRTHFKDPAYPAFAITPEAEEAARPITRAEQE